MELNHVENKLAQQRNDRDLQTAAMEIRTELELNSFGLAHGAQVRSRANFAEEGERNTAHFLNREEINNASNFLVCFIA